MKPTIEFRSHSFILPKPQLFKQCDSRWGADEMGVVGKGERDTVCHQGCAMSCVAMVLAGRNISLGAGQDPMNPGSLNRWLVAHQGYVCLAGDCCNLVLNTPDGLSSGKVRLIGEWGGKCCGGDDARPSLSTMQTLLNSSTAALIAHVRNSSHFVLLTQWDEAAKSFAANDPFFNQSHYAYTEISDVLVYSLLPSNAVVPRAYPLLEQFSYKWSEEKMVNATVGAVGCLMSSTAMALAGHGIDQVLHADVVVV